MKPTEEILRLRAHVLGLRSLVAQLPLTSFPPNVDEHWALQMWFNRMKSVMEQTAPEWSMSDAELAIAAYLGIDDNPKQPPDDY